jgi:hypothetical protein
MSCQSPSFLNQRGAAKSWQLSAGIISNSEMYPNQHTTSAPTQLIDQSLDKKHDTFEKQIRNVTLLNAAVPNVLVDMERSKWGFLAKMTREHGRSDL